METQNEEMRSVRTVTRELSSILTDLETGELEKCVVTKHGKMVAVIVTAEKYEELADATNA